MPISKLPEPLKKVVRPLYYFLANIRLSIHHFLWGKNVTDYHKIPVIINNFNRLTSLTKLIKWLETRGYYNIHIIDNASTFPPLLAYYDHCPYRVHRLRENMGFLALWKSPVHKLFKKQYYVYTDSDVVPVDECPEDFMRVFFKKLNADPATLKVGFSLKIDDLPDHYELKSQVLAVEETYYYHKESDGFYKANIDTTFALYKPGAKGGANLYRKMYRSAYPYQARHLPWYVDSSNIDKEELYYMNSVQRPTHWSSLSKKTASN